jgi:hypothetical protein
MKLIQTIGILLVFLGAGCSGVDTLYAPYEKYVDELENLADALDSAGNESEKANAFNHFADKVEVLRPDFEVLKKNPKYNQNELPPSLDDQEQDAYYRISGHTVYAGRYSKNRAFLEACKRYNEATQIRFRTKKDTD